jgi:S1-C subfamily serine protease
MSRNNTLILAVGCGFLLILAIGLAIAAVAVPYRYWTTPAQTVQVQPVPPDRQVQPAPTFTVPPPAAPAPGAAAPQAPPAAAPQQDQPPADLESLTSTEGLLKGRFTQLNPGVVNIQVFVSQAAGLRGGQGAGSGFVLDDAGHIITNHHVIDQAGLVIVVFYNGLQEYAEIVGSDANSDLAVLRVDTLPEGVFPLPLGDSNRVEVGDWAIAIGNPFGLGSSMTLGIVSATGRTIPSGVAQFSIPRAIQTDAAINPGNSGGPLISLAGEVIGVNAQIRTAGERGNTGVGFAIPVNVVRHIAPTLIAEGAYQWPWVGVEGSDVNLAIMQANNLESQHGAYINNIVPGGPAAQAGLRGSTGTRSVNGLSVPVGGDVVTEVDGRPIATFDDLLGEVAFRLPGEQIVLTVLRNNQPQQVTVTLAPRPGLEPGSS